MSRAAVMLLEAVSRFSADTVAAEAAQDIVAKVSGAKVTAAKAQSAVKAVFANA